MHRSRSLAAVAMAIATLLAVSAGAASATTSAVVGHVYVNNNTIANTISGFDRYADGSLTPIAGTPFAAGGAGRGTPTGSAGALQLSADRRYLLAVDAGAGGSNYTGFTLGAGGRLSPLARSTVALPDGANPGQVLFSPNGRHLVGTRVGPDSGPSFIDSFAVRPNGRLTAAPGSPFAAQGVGPFGSEFRPTNSSQLFVSNAHNGPGNGTVSAYNVAADGTLSAVTGSPFADSQT